MAAKTGLINQTPQKAKLEQERERLQSIAAPWPGAIPPAGPKPQTPIPRGYQHPLRVYKELITAVEVG